MVVSIDSIFVVLVLSCTLYDDFDDLMKFPQMLFVDGLLCPSFLRRKC